MLTRRVDDLPVRLGKWVENSAGDAADLRALKAQIVHQPLRVNNEGDDGAREGFGIDGPACADRDDYDRSIDADFPAICILESSQGFFGHEHDDEGSRLDAELKAE